MYKILAFVIILILILMVIYKSPMEESTRTKNEKMIILIEIMQYNGFWNAKTASDNPDWLFIYGDNDLHRGIGGQAIIRKSPNAIGIPTKKAPHNGVRAFYTDDEYNQNKIKIDNALEKINEKLFTGKYKTLVFPKNGFGTGLAQLNKRAPKTYTYLNSAIHDFVEKISPGSSKNLSFLN